MTDCEDELNSWVDKLMMLLSNYLKRELDSFSSNECRNLWGTNCFRPMRGFCTTLILSLQTPPEPIQENITPQKEQPWSWFIATQPHCWIGKTRNVIVCLMIVRISLDPLSVLESLVTDEGRQRGVSTVEPFSLGKVQHLVIACLVRLCVTRVAALAHRMTQLIKHKHAPQRWAGSSMRWDTRLTLIEAMLSFQENREPCLEVHRCLTACW